MLIVFYCENNSKLYSNGMAGNLHCNGMETCNNRHWHFISVENDKHFKRHGKKHETKKDKQIVCT